MTYNTSYGEGIIERYLSAAIKVTEEPLVLPLAIEPADQNNDIVYSRV